MRQSLCPLEESPHIGGVRGECSSTHGGRSERRSSLLILGVRGWEGGRTNGLNDPGGGSLCGCGGRVACGG